jgi:cyclophilin family peptidyl-prolyl cis-trans isomerase
MLLAATFALLAQAAVPATPVPEAAAKPAPVGPYLVMETSLGRIRIGLYKDKAPVSVDNFIQYARGGHYDGTIFHRVIPGFMAQGGGFEPDLTERPTRPPIKNESRNGLRNLRGTLAMARTSEPHSASSQFFINVKDNPFLDFGVARDGWGYAVFGEVVEGMDVVDKMVAVPTGTKGQYQNVPLTPVLIQKMREEGGGTTPAAAPKPAAPAKPAASPKPAPRPTTKP